MRYSMMIAVMILGVLAACTADAPADPADPFAEQNIVGQAPGDPSDLNPDYYVEARTTAAATPSHLTREPGQTVSFRVSTQDDAVWKQGYAYLPGHPNAIVDGWVPLTLSGTDLDDKWISGSATASVHVPSAVQAGLSEYGVLLYSCTREAPGQWDCLGNKWQAVEFSLTEEEVSDVTITDLSVSPRNTLAGEEVTFSAQLSLQNTDSVEYSLEIHQNINGTNQRYETIPGTSDGSITTSVIFPDEGLFQSKLSVKPEGAASWSDTQFFDLITIEPGPDTVEIGSFAVNGESVSDGETVQIFTDQPAIFEWTVDLVSGDPTAYHWEFIEDGTTVDVSTLSDWDAEHTADRSWSEEGKHTITLGVRAQGSDDSVHQDERTITVEVLSDTPSDPNDPLPSDGDGSAEGSGDDPCEDDPTQPDCQTFQ